MWALLFTVSTDVVISLVKSLCRQGRLYLALITRYVATGPQIFTSHLETSLPWWAPPYSRCSSPGVHSRC
jgi:hypothetical protein